MNCLDVKLPPYFFSPFVFHNTKRCTLTSRRWLRLRTRSLRLLPILHLFRGRARSSVFHLPHQILDASVTSHSFVSLPPKCVLYLRVAPRRLGVSSTIQRSSDSSLLLVFSRTTVLRHEARSLGSVSLVSGKPLLPLLFFSKYKITVVHLKGAPWGGFS